VHRSIHAFRSSCVCDASNVASWPISSGFGVQSKLGVGAVSFFGPVRPMVTTRADAFDASPLPTGTAESMI